MTDIRLPLFDKLMSDTTRTAFAVIVAVALAMTAFLAGFLVNDFMEAQTNEAVAAEMAPPGQMPIYAEVWARIRQSYIGAIPQDKELEYAAIHGSLQALGDPYTIFVKPVARQEEIERLRGNFGGIGVTLQRNSEGDVILQPSPGNPAALAGILAGDVLLAIDGQAINSELTVDEIAGQIRGEKGTEVVLTILHPGAASPQDVRVRRDDILIPSISARLLEEDTALGYIQVSRFSGETGREMRQAILDLTSQGATRMILDLRRNGGGLLDAAVDVADHFLDERIVLYQQSASEQEEVFWTTNETVAAGVPLVVLVDESTASASEIVAGALKDHGRATLIGTPTFGKGSVQLVYDLSDGSSIHVSAARWLTPNRHQIDQQGLEPDIAVQTTQEDIDNGRDPVLARAVEFLRQVEASSVP